MLRRLNDRLVVLSRDLKECSKRPGEALIKAARTFVEAVQRHVEGEEDMCAETERMTSTSLMAYSSACIHIYYIYTI